MVMVQQGYLTLLSTTTRSIRALNRPANYSWHTHISASSGAKGGAQ